MEYLNKLRNLGITRETTGKQKCPNCIATKKDKSATDLSVSFQSDRVVYNCHNGCGFTGAVFMSNSYNKPLKKTYQRPESKPANPTQDSMYKYFKGRGISKETIDKFGIYSTGTKLVFPYYKNGELVNHKYRWKTAEKEKNFMQDKEAEQVFYGMDLITDFTQLIIVEGEIDCLSLAEIGIESVSVPTGGSDNKLECIENCFEWLQKFDSYIIASDNDEVGNKLKDNLLSRLDKSKCKIAKYELEGNDGILSYKDANEVLTQCDFAKDFLTIVMDTAEYLPIDNIITYSDYEDQLLEFYDHGHKKGNSTGWANLDRLINIQTGYVMIITGRPSSGKSHIYKNMLYNLTKQYDWKHLLFDKESNLNHSFANMAMIHKDKFFNYGQERMSRTEAIESVKYLSKYFRMYPRVADFTIDEVLKIAKEGVKRYGINTLTIDPFNKIKKDCGEKGMLLYISEFMNKCGNFAVENNVLVTVIAHPTKPNYNKKFPDLYDVAGSADWANMTDYGIVMYREKKDNAWSSTTNVIVEKVKDDSLGNTSGGEIKLTKVKGRFNDLETGVWEEKKAKQGKVALG